MNNRMVVSLNTGIADVFSTDVSLICEIGHILVFIGERSNIGIVLNAVNLTFVLID